MDTISYIKIGNEYHPIDAITVNGLTLTSAEKATWNGKQDAMTFDSIPTENSENIVNSGDMYNVITDNELVTAAALNNINQRVSDLETGPLVNNEDISKNGQGELQFANRANTNGMGYKILRDDISFASQVTDTNTRYEVRYDFDLGNTTVSIPQGSSIFFVGGSISNGTLQLNENCSITSNECGELDDIAISLLGKKYHNRKCKNHKYSRCHPFRFN